MYERITGENAYKAPMRIYPAVHYTMGGLWVDYNLMSNLPGLFVLGEANFSDHGANRLGASALMQGLADGYFVMPVHHRQLPRRQPKRATKVATDHPEFKQAEADVKRPTRQSCLAIKGKRTRASFHRELGKVMWDDVRHGPDRGQPEGGAAAIPATARGVLEERERAGRRRRAEPGAGAGRPRGGLPGVRASCFASTR